jgi:hypothetical protein
MEAFFGLVLESLLGELIRSFFRRLGALIIWTFKPKKTHKEVLKEDYNTRVGFITALILTLGIIVIVNI